MKFCVFGSSSKATDQVYLDAAYELGQLIASEGHICTNGGKLWWIEYTIFILFSFTYLFVYLFRW